MLWCATKRIIAIFISMLFVTGCTTNMEYYIVGSGTETVVETVYETVYEEIEIPVYIEVEVPADPGEIWIPLFNLSQLMAQTFFGLLIHLAR